MPDHASLTRAHRARSPLVVLALMGLAAYLTLSGANTASGQTAPSDYRGYATATSLHADALQSGNTRVVNVDVAFSGASFRRDGLTSPLLNEMQRIVQPAPSGNVSYARGAGLEVGLGAAPSGPASITQAGLAEAAEPKTDTRQIAVPGSPLIYASLLRGQAINQCAPGCEVPLPQGDLAFGLGWAARVQLLNSGPTLPDGSMSTPVLSLDAPTPERAAARSQSRFDVERTTVSNLTFIGAIAEARVTIAPITLFRGTANQLTIELLGEWVLRAVAGGVGGTAKVHYGPRDVTPEAPILRTINAAGAVTNVLTFQQLFTARGTQIQVPGAAEIAIGEAPRAIGGAYGSAVTEASDGTEAAAAVDVLRVKVLEQRNAAGEVTTRAADVRLGHMEVRAQATGGSATTPTPSPSGSPTPSPTASPSPTPTATPGATPRPAEMTKTANPSEVFVGQSFQTTITVRNVYDCEIRSMRLTDDITAQEGRSARFTIVGTSPQADSFPRAEGLQRGTVIWQDIGPIAPGGSKQIVVTLLTSSAPEEIFPATITDVASGEGRYACADARVLANAIANATTQPLSVRVSAVDTRVPRGLPETGGQIALLALGGLTLVEAGYGILLLARKRRRQP